MKRATLCSVCDASPATTNGLCAGCDGKITRHAEGATSEEERAYREAENRAEREAEAAGARRLNQIQGRRA